MSRRRMNKKFADMVRVIDFGKNHYKETYTDSFCNNYDTLTLHRHYR
jgi:hypothetical protein